MNRNILKGFKLSGSRGRYHLLSKDIGRNPTNGRMGAHRVVEALNVMKDSIFSLPSGYKSGQMNQLVFEAAKEVFRNRIVIWITLSRHTGKDAVLFKLLPVSIGSVLRTTIAVKNQPGPGLFVVYGYA